VQPTTEIDDQVAPCLRSPIDSSGVITGAIVPKPSDGFMPSDRRFWHGVLRVLRQVELSHDGCPRTVVFGAVPSDDPDVVEHAAAAGLLGGRRLPPRGFS
jgi:hypothetical protein